MDSSDWQQQRKQAEQIWRAGVKAVDSMKLVQEAVSVSEKELIIGHRKFPLSKLGRVLVVGAGKAGAGMAAGFEAALPENFLQENVTGWMNVPANCVRPMKKIHLHPARPAAVNEPTTQAVQGTEKILELVWSLEPDDLCVVLISGGGSALLPAPVPGITLEDKIGVTRALSRAGASIEELNIVRSSLSSIKAGGLLRACRSKRMVTLIISDVIGDPLETIASGPTVPAANRNEQAVKILEQYIPGQIPENVSQYFAKQKLKEEKTTPENRSDNLTTVEHIILGNNETAVRAASESASQLGCEVINLGSDKTGLASEVGLELVQAILKHKKQNPGIKSICLICGGESVVEIDPQTQPGKGGRNQEIALAALTEIARNRSADIVLLAGGTDGEDGPTDAAGAFADIETLRRANRLNLDLSDYLHRHDSYHFFQQCDSLLITGPTNTNVMDLTVVLASNH